MSLYFYKAKNLQGEEISGSLEATTEKQLAQTLRNQGYFLFSAKTSSDSNESEQQDSKEIKKQKIGLGFIGKFFGVSLTEKLFFTRNLEVMVKSGVSLVRSFEILSCQTRSQKFKTILISISTAINKGESLSSALGHYPNVFPNIFQETIRVGEETGRLENALRTLSKQMEREHSLKSKVKSAMVYPVIVLIMAFGIGVFMMIFAVPKIRVSFLEMGVELPMTTKIILGFADILTRQWILCLLLGIGVGGGVWFFLKTGKGGKIKSTLWLKIPVISKLTRQMNSALTLRTLSSLLQSGVPIVRALNIASGALANFYFKNALRQASVGVEKGEKLSVALKKHQTIFAPMIVQMIEVGEETGETSEILEKLSDFLEEEVGASTQRLSSIIEPILIMGVGAAVGLFAVSMMQPMFNVMSGIK